MTLMISAFGERAVLMVAGRLRSHLYSKVEEEKNSDSGIN